MPPKVYFSFSSSARPQIRRPLHVRKLGQWEQKKKGEETASAQSNPSFQLSLQIGHCQAPRTSLLVSLTLHRIRRTWCLRPFVHAALQSYSTESGHSLVSVSFLPSTGLLLLISMGSKELCQWALTLPSFQEVLHLLNILNNETIKVK